MSKLHFHYGVMQSAKSAMLIMTAHNFQLKNTPVEIIKPLSDTRSTTVKSRATKDEAEALVLKSFDNYEPAPKTKVILVDEIQFFAPSDIDCLVRIADIKGLLVICYGLMVDSNEKLFPTSARLVEVGAKLHQAETSCMIPECMHFATHHLRFDADGNVIRGGDQICVGDSNYKSVCRMHFNQIYHGLKNKQR